MSERMPSFQPSPLIKKIEREGLNFVVWCQSPVLDYGLINPAFAQRISDQIPRTAPFGGPSILYLMGIPLRTDESIPSGEIHFYVKDALAGKIEGLEND